jgi:hypothetical protein
MMDWSWDLLDDDEQRMLTELAVFRGGFDMRGVDEVCSAPREGSRFEVLTGLVDRSLVQVTADSGVTSRYQLLETVRLYGLDRLAAAGMADDVRDRHASWIRRQCGCLRPSLSWDLGEAFYSIRNVDNVLAAAEWFARSGDVVATAEVLSGQPGLFAGDRNVEGARWFTPAFVGDEQLPIEVALAVAVVASQTAVFAGDYATAGRFARHGLSLLDAMERQPTSDVTRFWAAQTCLFAGMLAVGVDIDGARRLLGHARELGAGALEGAPTMAVFVALIALDDGDFEAAVAATDLTFDDRFFEVPSLGVIRMTRAMAMSWLGRHDEALAATMVHGVVGGIAMRTPNSVGTAQVSWVLLRAGRVQEALDLIARPSRLAIGAAVEQWRVGRALFLAEYVLERDPGLAARLVGCVPQAVTITLGLRRRDVLRRVEGRIDQPVDELLAAGGAAGEDATVAEAHEIIRADGYAP